MTFSEEWEKGMAKKYYAVAKGKTPGIYFTWDDCKTQIEHFSGAIYKGFATLQEAESFIDNVAGEGSANKVESIVSSQEHLIAYVDGSYEHSQLRYAYGCVLVLPEGEITLNGSDNQEDYVSMRNVAGEIMGSQQAILWAVEHGYKKITIYYDYEGIEKWANGIWKANKVGTQCYKEFVAKQRERIEIGFQKVEAHTGVKYNEMADQLAKQALGIQ